jgi:hypothetical protein
MIMRTPFALVPLILCEACGAPAGPLPDSTDPDPVPTGPSAMPCVPGAQGSAPTYTELFTRYFAQGTPGHCATAGCHANPGLNVWLCGDTKDTCYAGMVAVGLVDPEHPLASLIANPTQSALSWINPTGNMPFDAVAPLPDGRDAILAWVAACAPND